MREVATIGLTLASRSCAVSTATTPGAARAAVQSIDTMRACACSLRRNATSARGGAIARHDPRMRVRAAAERAVHHARPLPVVRVAAEPGEQTRVLGTLDARADDFWPHHANVSHRSPRRDRKSVV